MQTQGARFIENKMQTDRHPLTAGDIYCAGCDIRGMFQAIGKGCKNATEYCADETRLKYPALVFFGLAYMVPLGIFTTYGQVTVLSEGHLPVAYIITLTAVLFTALSYCKMTSTLPLAGSAYSYVQKIFGGNAGFLVGWAQLLDYLFLPIINYIAIGIFVHEVPCRRCRWS